MQGISGWHVACTGHGRAMKSILTTYPEFRTLPTGVKKLLLESEDFFFMEARPPMGPSPVFKRAGGAISDKGSRVFPRPLSRPPGFGKN
jgi:hypothetical protein